MKCYSPLIASTNIDKFRKRYHHEYSFLGKVVLLSLVISLLMQNYGKIQNNYNTLRLLLVGLG